jgi:aminopeptidase N
MRRPRRSISTAMTGRPARSRIGSGVRGRHRAATSASSSAGTPGRHDRLVLLAHDSDPFNRWEAGRSLMRETLIVRRSPTAPGRPRPLRGPRDRTANDDTLDPAFRALALALPSEDDLAQAMSADAGSSSPTRSRSMPSARPRLPLQDGRGPGAPLLARPLRQRSTPAPITAPMPARPPRAACATPAWRYLTRVEGPDRARAQYDAAQEHDRPNRSLHGAAGGSGRPLISRPAFFEQWQGRPAGDGQMVHGPGRPCRPERRRRHGAERADPSTRFSTGSNPNRFRSVIGGADRGQSSGLPRPVRRGIPVRSPTGSSGWMPRTRRQPRVCRRPSRHANATTPTGSP